MRILQLLLLLMLVSCGATKNFYVSPDYSAQKLSTQKLHYKAVGVDIVYPRKALKKQFGDVDSIQFLQNLIDSITFTTVVTSKLHTPFSPNILRTTHKTSSQKFNAVLDVNNSPQEISFTTTVPAKEELKNVTGNGAGIVLMLSSPKFFTKSENLQNGYVNIAVTSVGFSTNYIMWDYAKNQPVAFGTATSINDALEKKYQNDWANSIHKVVIRILNDSKFIKEEVAPKKSEVDRNRVF